MLRLDCLGLILATNAPNQISRAEVMSQSFRLCAFWSITKKSRHISICNARRKMKMNFHRGSVRSPHLNKINVHASLKNAFFLLLKCILNALNVLSLLVFCSQCAFKVLFFCFPLNRGFQQIKITGTRAMYTNRVLRE